jgi:hypothetical protein
MQNKINKNRQGRMDLIVKDYRKICRKLPTQRQ